MNGPSNESHAHVLDPSWSQAPIPWAETADPTLIPRLHAACLDNCWDCLTDLAHEAVSSPADTAVVFAMGVGYYAMITPPARPVVDSKLEQAAAFLGMIRRVQGYPGGGVSGPEVLDMVRGLEWEDRWQIIDGAVQLMGLHTQVLQRKEP